MYKQIQPTYRTLLILLLNLVLIIITYIIFLKLDVINVTPDEFNVIRYDGEWFNMIRNSGYSYAANQMSNMAFFPLFPYIWREVDIFERA